MTRKSALISAALLIAFLAAWLVAGGVGLASSVSSPSGEGTPSGDSLSLVGGLVLLAFGIVALGFALRVLLTKSRGQATEAERQVLAAAWALAGMFLLFAALSAWVHFVPLNDYAKPIIGLVLMLAGATAAVASGYCFRAAFSRADQADLAQSR